MGSAKLLCFGPNPLYSAPVHVDIDQVPEAFVIVACSSATMTFTKIVSGGQTGVDRGALDAALAASFACGGWVAGYRFALDVVTDVIRNMGSVDSAADQTP